MAKYKVEDIKIGDKVKIDTYNDEGTVLYIGGNVGYNILVEHKKGCNEGAFSNHDATIQTIVKGKKCFWVDINDITDIVRIVRMTARTEPKLEGGYCRVCNLFNAYQDGPYTCFVHKH